MKLDKKNFKFSGFASKASIIIYGLLLLFHLVIITGAGIVDYITVDIVWGGRIETKEQLVILETISFLAVLLCLFLTMIKTGYLKIKCLSAISHYSMWILSIYFLLNTVGNITADTFFEKSLALISAALSILSFRLAMEKRTAK